MKIGVKKGNLCFRCKKDYGNAAATKRKSIRRMLHSIKVELIDERNASKIKQQNIK